MATVCRKLFRHGDGPRDEAADIANDRIITLRVLSAEEHYGDISNAAPRSRSPAKEAASMHDGSPKSHCQARKPGWSKAFLEARPWDLQTKQMLKRDPWRIF